MAHFDKATCPGGHMISETEIFHHENCWIRGLSFLWLSFHFSVFQWGKGLLFLIWCVSSQLSSERCNLALDFAFFHTFIFRCFRPKSAQPNRQVDSCSTVSQAHNLLSRVVSACFHIVLEEKMYPHVVHAVCTGNKFHQNVLQLPNLDVHICCAPCERIIVCKWNGLWNCDLSCSFVHSTCFLELCCCFCAFSINCCLEIPTKWHWELLANFDPLAFGFQSWNASFASK